jgi:hypothetical protein
MSRPQTVAELGDRIFPWALLLTVVILFLGKFIPAL